MTSIPNESVLYNPPLNEYYMARPRVDKIFDQASACKLVYVIAGAGYGKTRSVHHYIERQQEAVVRWMQLTESDNSGTRYWESLTHSISFDNPDLALKLRELGFPESLARFRQFAEIVKNSEHRSQKTYLVLDDFHLIRSQQALTFAERCAYLHVPGACVIIISRNEPAINAVSLFSRGMASIITEDELRFTDDEIAEFMKLRGIPFRKRDLRRVIDVTKGWALAIKLLSLVLTRIPENLDHALETMKQNIFRLLEFEAFGDFPENVKKNLVRLSLVSDLPLTPLQEITGDVLMMRGNPQLASFMWYDSFIGDYRVHPLYLEFLLSRRSLLTEEEKLDTYRKAAKWCHENNFLMDAMDFYAKSRQYDKMLDAFLSYPFKLPADACEFFIVVLETIGCGDGNDRSVLLLKGLILPLLLIGSGKIAEAEEITQSIIREREDYDDPFSPYLLYTAYSNLAYIGLYTCTVTHRYDFMPYMKKAVEYYKKSSTEHVRVEGQFAVVDVRSFACLVGAGAARAEPDAFLEASRQTAPYIAETYHFMYYGYADLVACELAFFRNQTEASRNHAHGAILKAREKKQHSIEAMAEQYLLRIAMHEGDVALTKELFKQLRVHLDNPDFWNRRLLYDLFAGYCYIQAGLPEMAPAWLVMDEKDDAPEVRIPVRELIVGVKYHIAMKKYNRALTILSNSYPRDPQERFMLGELTLSLLTAVCRLRTGDMDGALLEFDNSYDLSFDGEFEMPFVELGKELRPLAAAALKSPDCRAPKAWLRTVALKASVYAKKTAVLTSSLKENKKAAEVIPLSEREREVLNDLYHGLSREEIAVNRYLSINTVKKILQSIYIKLDANNNVDAVRIAIDKKLVE